MKNNSNEKSSVECRLCGGAVIIGIDIFGGKSRQEYSQDRNSISEIILRCIQIRVETSDTNTKICEECYCTLHNFDRFREKCATHHMMQRSKQRLLDEAGDIITDIKEENIANNSESDSLNTEPMVSDDGASPTQIKIKLYESLSSTSQDQDVSQHTCSITSSNRNEKEASLPLQSTNDSEILLEICTRSPAAKGKEIAACGNRTMKSKKKEKSNTEEIPSSFPIKCKAHGNCKEFFESTADMEFHIDTYHAERVKRKFWCYLCKKDMKTKHLSMVHMNALHSHRNPFMCPYRACSRVFWTKYLLKTHLEAVHTKKTSFDCTKCHQKFYRKLGLKNHLARKHAKEMPFSC